MSSDERCRAATPDCVVRVDNFGWSLYGAPWLQPAAINGKSSSRPGGGERLFAERRLRLRDRALVGLLLLLVFEADPELFAEPGGGAQQLRAAFLFVRGDRGGREAEHGAAGAAASGFTEPAQDG